MKLTYNYAFGFVFKIGCDTGVYSLETSFVDRLICSTHMKFQNNIFYSRYTEDLTVHKFSQNSSHFCTKWHTSASMEGGHEKKCFYLTIIDRQGNLYIHSHSSQPFSPVWNVNCNAASSNKVTVSDELYGDETLLTSH